jgi:hypothetical protein
MLNARWGRDPSRWADAPRPVQAARWRSLNSGWPSSDRDNRRASGMRARLPGAVVELSARSPALTPDRMSRTGGSRSERRFDARGRGSGAILKARVVVLPRVARGGVSGPVDEMATSRSRLTPSHRGSQGRCDDTAEATRRYGTASCSGAGCSPWASATAGWMIRPAETFTPAAKPG